MTDVGTSTAPVNLPDSTKSMGIGDFSSTLKGMSDPEFASYKAGLEERKKIASEGKTEAGRRAQAQIMADYGSTMFSKPAPKFEPSQEDLSGFAALGALLTVSGAMMGSKGKTSGLMAMNAITGMMNGYQKGRNDLYEKERQRFEMSMKEWERERGQIKEAFDMALKMAPTNYKGAVDFLNKTLSGMGVTMPKAMIERSGLTYTAGVVTKSLENAGTQAKAIASKTGLSADQRVTVAQETARREAEAKSLGTGALEYGELGGVTGMYTREQILQAQKSGQAFKPLAKPTSSTKTIKFEGKNVLADSTGTPLRNEQGEVIEVPDTSKGVAQQQQNQRIINATAGAASAFEAIKNIKGGTTTGILPFIGDKEGMISFLKTAAGRALTDDDAKILDVYYAGLARNIAAIEASGAATGLVGLTKTFETLKPMVGDSNYVVAAKLADGRRIVEETVTALIDSGILTKEQSATAKGLVKRVENAIPYTVSDVNNALATTREPGEGTIGSETESVVKPQATQSTQATPTTTQPQPSGEAREQITLPQDVNAPIVLALKDSNGRMYYFQYKDAEAFDKDLKFFTTYKSIKSGVKNPNGNTYWIFNKGKMTDYEVE